VPPQTEAKRVEAGIFGMKPSTPGVSLEVDGRINRPALERTPRNQQLWETARSLGARLGLDLEEGAAGGGSDGSFTSQLTATLDGLGAVGDGAHAPNEHLQLEGTIRRAALLALLIAEPPAETRVA
jgi:glutamate carboxypeptidase